MRGARYPRRGVLISDTFSEKRGSNLARTRMGRRGAVPPQISCPGYRTRPRRIVSSILTYASIHDGLGAIGNDISSIVVVQNAITEPHLAYRRRRRNQARRSRNHRRATLVLDTSSEKAGYQTGEDKYGEARCRTVANLVSGLASTPSDNRVLRSTINQHLQPSRRSGKRYFVHSCCPKRNYTYVLAYRRNRSKQVPGPHYPRRDTLILATSYPQRGSKPARTSMARHGAVLLRISSPGWRAHLWTIVSPKVAYASVYDELGTMESDISSKVVVRNAFTHPYWWIAVAGATKYADRTVPAEEHSSWLPPTRSGVANRGGQVWRGTVPCRRKTRL